jgi:hypothetical protein
MTDEISELNDQKLMESDNPTMHSDLPVSSDAISHHALDPQQVSDAFRSSSPRNGSPIHDSIDDETKPSATRRARARAHQFNSPRQPRLLLRSAAGHLFRE